MPIALIFCPYTLLDTLDNTKKDYFGTSQETKILFNYLAREVDRVCIDKVKRYKGFMSKPVQKIFIEVTIAAMNLDDEERKLKLIEVLKTMHAVFETSGTMESGECFESVLELARELDDEYDVYIVSAIEHRGQLEKAKRELKKKGNNFNYDEFSIITISEALSKLIIEGYTS